MEMDQDANCDATLPLEESPASEEDDSENESMDESHLHRTNADQAFSFLSQAIDQQLESDYLNDGSSLSDTQKRETRASLESLKTRFHQHGLRQHVFIGGTGAGKSTLINALLGRHERIVRQSNMKACTSVATKFMFHDESHYLVHVHMVDRESFLNEMREHWNHMQLLFEDQPASEWRRGDDLDIRRVFDILTAAFGTLTDASFEEHWNAANVSQKLAKRVKKIARKTLAGLIRVVQNYTGPDDEHSSNTWVFVKEVVVYGRFDALRNGTVLVDLPGTRDENQSRDRVYKSHLQEAHTIHICSPITRAISDQTVRDLLKECIQTLMLEGKTNALSFVLTKMDDINVAETIQELPHLRQHAIFHEVDTIQKKLRNLQKQLSKSEPASKKVHQLLRERDAAQATKTRLHRDIKMLCVRARNDYCTDEWRNVIRDQYPQLNADSVEILWGDNDIR